MEDITLKTILEHLQAFRVDITTQLHTMENRMTQRMDGLEHRVDSLEVRIDRMDRNLSRQIDAIDKRLDAIEIEEVPKRVRRIEEHVGLAAA